MTRKKNIDIAEELKQKVRNKELEMQNKQI